MIAVLVNGMRDSFYCDSKDGKWPIESVIIKELIPHVDKTYRTVARTGDAGRGGLLDGRLRRGAPGVQVSRGVRDGGRDGRGTDRRPARASSRASSKRCSARDNDYVKANDPFELVRKNADAIRGRTASASRWAIRTGLQRPRPGVPRAARRTEDRARIRAWSRAWRTTARCSTRRWARALSRSYQKAHLRRRPSRATGRTRRRESHVFKRGDVEILSFDTEEDYDRLQELYRAEPGDASPRPAR